MLTRIRASLSGRYVIEQELGRGASAAVYLAHDLKHGRRVALKVITEDLTGSIGATRFLQEIRTTAGLNHPHILPLFDSGTADGLLYFTMPHVAGESLRARLDRKPALTRPEADRILREMADAIAHAHGAGIVHRDLKPENVLLGPDGHVWIADFGLSRALTSAIDHRLSSRGLAVGSPAYMSPEQAAGDEHVDGRSDIYSLGCVAFETLTGEAPFRGNSVASLMAKHVSGPTPSARDRNPEVSAAADAALRRAMARQPADRFGDAREFVRALGDDSHIVVPHDTSTVHTRLLLRRGVGAAVGCAALLLLMYGIQAGSMLDAFRGVPPDTTRYAVFPFDHAERTTSRHEQQRMHEALAFWSGITMVDRFEVQDAIAQAGGTVETVSDAKRIARELGAGRLVRGSVTALRDSLVVYAALYDATDGTSALADASVRLHADGDLEAQFIRLADALLFRGAAVPVRSNAESETDSRPALNAYYAAQDAIAEWDLTRADSLFNEAVTLDDDYGRAFVWLAQTRFWRSRPTPEWRLPAERANERAHTLPAREQQLLAALLSLARGDYPEACAQYRALLEQGARDFAATYGLAECYRNDRLVLADPSSPTGWTFRSSGHQAVLHYRRAFEQLPATHRAFRSGRFERLRDYVFFTATSAHREGLNADGTQFWAVPSWEGDTLAFHPVESLDMAQGYWMAGPSTETAIRMLRRMFFDVTTTWVAAYPASADALEAHAVALELLGDARALPTLREARGIATDSEHALNLAISEFWLRFRRAVPRASAEVRAARLIADSILSTTGQMEPHTAGRMAAVAAVTGRAARAAQLSRVAAQGIVHMPLAVSEPGAALLAFAAVGGPVDSIAAAELAVERAIANTVAPHDAGSVRQELLCRAAPLSFHAYRMRIVESPEGERDFLVAAHAALARGDFAATRATLDDMAAARAGVPPAEIELEGLVPEAWLLYRMNDAAGAGALLDPTLEALRYTEPPGGLESIASAGQLARALLLRAEIAHALNDPQSAREWAAAFVELWHDADPTFDAAIRRARQLAALSQRSD